MGKEPTVVNPINNDGGFEDDLFNVEDEQSPALEVRHCKGKFRSLPMFFLLKSSLSLVHHRRGQKSKKMKKTKTAKPRATRAKRMPSLRRRRNQKRKSRNQRMSLMFFES